MSEEGRTRCRKEEGPGVGRRKDPVSEEGPGGQREHGDLWPERQNSQGLDRASDSDSDNDHPMRALGSCRGPIW